MQLGKKETIVFGLCMTVIPLMITSWSIKAGLLFAVGYPLIAKVIDDDHMGECLDLHLVWL